MKMKKKNVNTVENKKVKIAMYNPEKVGSFEMMFGFKQTQLIYSKDWFSIPNKKKEKKESWQYINAKNVDLKKKSEK